MAAAAPHLERLRHLAWESFAYTLPPGWEVTGYHFGEREGRLQFHRREQPRGEATWRPMDGTPDHARMLGEVLRRWLAREAPAEAAAFTGPRTRRVGEFTLAWVRPGAPCLASLWQADERRLVQWTFPDHSPERLEEELVPLLQSFQPNRGDERRWELFGLRLRLPAAYRFEGIRPRPANVRLEFETRKRMRLVVRRIGMPEQTLAGMGLDDLARRLLAMERTRPLRIVETEVRGFRGVRAEFERRRESQLESLIGRWWKGEALLWRDDQEGRIYSFEQFGPDQQPRLELAHAWL